MTNHGYIFQHCVCGRLKLRAKKTPEKPEKQPLFCGVFWRLKRGTQRNSDNTVWEYFEGQQGVRAVIAQCRFNTHCTVCTGLCLCAISVEIPRRVNTTVLWVLLLSSPSSASAIVLYYYCYYTAAIAWHTLTGKMSTHLD